MYNLLTCTSIFNYFNSNKKLSYRRDSARCVKQPLRAKKGSSYSFVVVPIDATRHNNDFLLAFNSNFVNRY